MHYDWKNGTCNAFESVLSVEAVPEDVEHMFQGNFFFKLPMFLISLHQNYFRVHWVCLSVIHLH
jgi:hypothetical protein